MLLGLLPKPFPPRHAMQAFLAGRGDVEAHLFEARRGWSLEKAHISQKGARIGAAGFLLRNLDEVANMDTW